MSTNQIVENDQEEQINPSKNQEYMTAYLQQGTIKLKPLTSLDALDVMVYASDDEVTKYMMWDSYKSVAELESFLRNIAEKHPFFNAICYEGNVVGSITLELGKGDALNKAELGYVLSRKYWGKGIATQAVRLAVEIGFQELGLTKIEALVDPENPASRRVLEKNGFLNTGLLKNHVVQKGIPKDRFFYGLERPHSS